MNSGRYVVYVVKLRVLAGAEGIRALRQFLKRAWRDARLRCVSIEEQPENQQTGANNGE
jgi:hypothetical protein